MRGVRERAARPHRSIHGLGLVSPGTERGGVQPQES
jgi:hypothetical protein